ncbi:MAG TPA: hypothetical protein VGK64_18590 [Bryobacteraceae bacterium]
MHRNPDSRAALYKGERGGCAFHDVEEFYSGGMLFGNDPEIPSA